MARRRTGRRARTGCVARRASLGSPRCCSRSRAACSGAAARGRRAFLDAGVPLQRVARRRAAHRHRHAALRVAAAAADESGVGDEARHDVRGARAARPRLSLEDRGLSCAARSTPACCTATWCSRATAIPKITIEQWQAFMAVAARQRPRRHPRRPGARPQRLRAAAARSGRVRRRAAEALQRRPRRAAGQLQVGAASASRRTRRMRRST